MGHLEGGAFSPLHITELRREHKVVIRTLYSIVELVVLHYLQPFTRFRYAFRVGF